MAPLDCQPLIRRRIVQLSFAPQRTHWPFRWCFTLVVDHRDMWHPVRACHRMCATHLDLSNCRTSIKQSQRLLISFQKHCLRLVDITFFAQSIGMLQRGKCISFDFNRTVSILSNFFFLSFAWPAILSFFCFLLNGIFNQATRYRGAYERY